MNGNIHSFKLFSHCTVLLHCHLVKLRNSIFVVEKKNITSTVEQINWANFSSTPKDTCSFQDFRFPKPRNKTKPRDLFIFLCNSILYRQKIHGIDFFLIYLRHNQPLCNSEKHKNTMWHLWFFTWHATRRNILDAEEDIAILFNFFAICLDLGIIGKFFVHCQGSVSIFQWKRKFERFLIQGFMSLMDCVSYLIRV